MTTISSLTGIHEQIDQFIDDLGFFGTHLAYKNIIPGNVGDVSCLLTPEATEALLAIYGRSDRFFKFSNLADLLTIRNDGRNYYKAESIPESLLKEYIRPLAGRVLIITAAGAKLWDITRNPSKRLCAIQVSPNCEGIYLLYGNEQYGTIPSIETPSHLVATAFNIQTGLATSSVLHCHPPLLVAACACAPIAGNYEAFNKMLFSQKEGLLTNASDLIGIIDYHPAGSAALLEASIPSIHKHRLNIWAQHGVLIREESLEYCIDLLEHAEDAAAATLRVLTCSTAFKQFNYSDIEHFVHMYHLRADILDLMK